MPSSSRDAWGIVFPVSFPVFSFPGNQTSIVVVLMDLGTVLVGSRPWWHSHNSGFVGT